MDEVSGRRTPGCCSQIRSILSGDSCNECEQYDDVQMHTRPTTDQRDLSVSVFFWRRKMELEKGCVRACVRHGRWEKKTMVLVGNASFSSGVDACVGDKKASRGLFFQLPPMGLEPTTFALGRQRTTIVLRRLDSRGRRGAHHGRRGADRDKIAPMTMSSSWTSSSIPPVRSSSR